MIEFAEMREGPCVAAGPFSPLVYGYARGCSSTVPGRRSAYAKRLLAQKRPFSCNIDYSRHEKAAARKRGGIWLPFAGRRNTPFREMVKSPEMRWRSGRDSNPRYAFDVYSLSRRAPSTTRPPLRMHPGRFVRSTKRESGAQPIRTGRGALIARQGFRKPIGHGRRGA